MKLFAAIAVLASVFADEVNKAIKAISTLAVAFRYRKGLHLTHSICFIFTGITMTRGPWIEIFMNTIFSACELHEPSFWTVSSRLLG